MSFRAFRGRAFDHTHENIAFNQLYDLLEKNWGTAIEPLYLFGNFFVDNKEFDALILKRNAIIIVDFKDYGGSLSFSLNNFWKIDGVIVKGGNSINPYVQLRNNKFELKNFLETTDIQIKSNPNLGHISALVLFQKDIKFDPSVLPPKLSRWFFICDMRNAIRSIDAIASNRIYFEDLDLSALLEAFDVPEFFPDGTDEIGVSDSISDPSTKKKEYNEATLKLPPEISADQLKLLENISNIDAENIEKHLVRKVKEQLLSSLLEHVDNEPKKLSHHDIEGLETHLIGQVEKKVLPKLLKLIEKEKTINNRNQNTSNFLESFSDAKKFDFENINELNQNLVGTVKDEILTILKTEAEKNGRLENLSIYAKNISETFSKSFCNTVDDQNDVNNYPTQINHHKLKKNVYYWGIIHNGVPHGDGTCLYFETDPNNQNQHFITKKETGLFTSGKRNGFGIDIEYDICGQKEKGISFNINDLNNLKSIDPKDKKFGVFCILKQYKGHFKNGLRHGDGTLQFYKHSYHYFYHNSFRKPGEKVLYLDLVLDKEVSGKFKNGDISAGRIKWSNVYVEKTRYGAFYQYKKEFNGSIKNYQPNGQGRMLSLIDLHNNFGVEFLESKNGLYEKEIIGFFDGEKVSGEAKIIERYTIDNFSHITAYEDIKEYHRYEYVGNILNGELHGIIKIHSSEYDGEVINNRVNRFVHGKMKIITQIKKGKYTREFSDDGVNVKIEYHGRFYEVDPFASYRICSEEDFNSEEEKKYRDAYTTDMAPHGNNGRLKLFFNGELKAIYKGDFEYGHISGRGELKIYKQNCFPEKYLGVFKGGPKSNNDNYLMRNRKKVEFDKEIAKYL